MFTNETLQQPNLNIEELLDSLINTNNIDLSTLEKSLVYFDKINNFLEDMNSELDVKKLKSQRELEQCIKVCEINLDSKRNEKELIYQTLTQLKDKFTDVYEAIEQLKVEEDNPTQKLLNLDKEIQELQITEEIIDHFVSFQDNQSNPQLQIYYLRSPLQKACHQLWVLQQVAQSLKNERFNKAKINIENVYQDMQQYLLKEFQDSYWRLNINKINELLPLIENYQIIRKVNQFYIDKRFNELKISMMSPNQTYFELSTALTKIYKEIQIIYENSLSKKSQSGEKNYFALSEIFQGYSSQLLHEFVNFTFNIIIKTIMSQLLNQKLKLQQYLQNYGILYSLTEELINSIKDIEHNVNVINLRELCDQFFRNIIEEYQSTYNEKEFQWLSEELEKNINKLLSSLGVKQKQYGEQKKKLSKDEISKRLNQITEILTEEFIENIFQAIQISLQRNQKINQGESRTQMKIKCIQIFLIQFGDNFLRNIIEYTNETIPELNRKNSVNPNFFQVIPQLNTFVQRIDIICNQFMKDYNEQQQLQALILKKESLLQSLEIHINKGVQLAIASIIIGCKRILQEKQNKKDYLLKSMGIQEEATEACKELNKFVSQYIQQIQKYKSNQIKKSIFQSFGEQLIIILVEHFSLFTVSISGSSVLAIDISTYRQIFFELDDEQVLKEFKVLEVLTNLFKISKTQLKKYVRDEPLFKTLSQDVISSYIAKREEKE